MKRHTALVLIDIQQGFDDLAYWGGNRNNPDAEKNASALLNHWRRKNMPVFHVKHDSTNPQSRLAPGQPGNEIKDMVRPVANEPVISKNVNSAFIGTELQQRLHSLNVTTVVIAGLTTDHCVSTTARMAANLGFKTFVVSDATATFDRKGPGKENFPAALIHQTALASLHDEFATIVSTTDVINNFQ